jgi:HSP20 family protein
MVMRRSRTLYPIDQLRGEMDRLVTGFLGNPATAGAARYVAARTFPAVNVWETGEELYAEAEVPGLKSEDVEISVVGNELTIKGERREVEQPGSTYHRRERGVGNFTRVLALPVDIDGERVEASLKDGVLLIRLPKAEAAKPRKIQVNASGTVPEGNV